MVKVYLRSSGVNDETEANKYDIIYDDDNTVKEGIKETDLKTTDGRQVENSFQVEDSVKGPHVSALMSVFEVSTVRDTGGSKDVASTSLEHDNSSPEFRMVSNAKSWYDNIKKRHNKNQKDTGQKDVTAGIVAVLASLARFQIEFREEESSYSPHEREVIKKVKSFRDITEENLWTFRKFKSAYQDIPELVELTTTPFMTKIGKVKFYVGLSDRSMVLAHASSFVCSLLFSHRYLKTTREQATGSARDKIAVK